VGLARIGWRVNARRARWVRFVRWRRMPMPRACVPITPGTASPPGARTPRDAHPAGSTDPW